MPEKNDHFHPPTFVMHANPSVFNEIWQERKRQNEKWGEQNHNPFVWLSILGEEVGEAHKAALESTFSFDENEGASLQDLREELIQVAAVAEAIIESLDRNELKPKSIDNS